MTNASPAGIWSEGDYRLIAGDHQIASERICQDLPINAGQRVLDIACGTGNTTVVAARRRAQVTALDVATVMLDAARKRCADELLTNVTFEIGDVGRLPFADSSFDVVVSTFGAVFLPDQVLAASEMLRVLRPGGRLGLTSHKAQSVPGDVYRLGAALIPPPEGAALPAFAWASGPHVRELLGDHVDALTLTPYAHDTCFNSPQDYVDHYCKWYGPMVTRLARMTAQQKADYCQGMAAIVAAHNAATDGTLNARFDYLQITAVKRRA